MEIPHNELVVITGLSGSGKSTLAFDTIFAEGQRRYVESLSAYARQFLGRIDKPEVDFITGLAPAIAIEQKVSSRNPRSTVGTNTEIYDYLKLLFARIGKTYSPISGSEVRSWSVADVVEQINLQDEGTRIMICAPLVVEQQQGLIERLTLMLRDGFERLYYNGQTMLIDEFLPNVDQNTKSEDISIVISRVKLRRADAEQLSQIGDSIERAFSYGGGVCRIVAGDLLFEFSSRFDADGMTFEEPTEHLFSFNNPIGACPRCDGYGKVEGIDEDLVVPDKTKSIYNDAISCWRGATMKTWKEELIANASKFDFPIHKPYYELSSEERLTLWRGNSYFNGLDDFFKFIEAERYKVQYRVMLSRYSGRTICPDCGGSRLRKEALYVKVGGKTIAQMVAMPVERLVEFFSNIELDQYDVARSKRILTEVKNRLQYLMDVGLGYLTLDRLSSTLSGGESQRINLSTSLGSSLVGSLYILDEPSIGLHPRDTANLIKVLKQLRDLGNTVIVVEHEEQVIRAADRLIDIGPLAGYQGGEVVFNGTLKELEKNSNSLTGDYLFGRKSIPKPTYRRQWRNFIEIKGARENNLKGVDVKFPLGVISCITGVSGSGKSSLVKGILYPALRRHIYDLGVKPGHYDSMGGDLSLLKSVELIDQNPIGRSSRSNPVTYIKAYDDIRKIFADQPYSKHNALTASHFSFNSPGGRCEECQGEGVIKVSMQFMADVELKCECCAGRRFKDEVLNVKFNDKNIYDVLEMSIDQAVDFFSEHSGNTIKSLIEKLKTLQAVGLGYVKLGQSSSTLSGGESQRIKLASFLTKERNKNQILFIFDEPTTGLHFHDINKLLASFNALVERGHTVLIVEHNMDVINASDYVIDLGLEGGDNGGYLLFEGTPDEMVKCENSYTAQFLAKHNGQ